MQLGARVLISVVDVNTFTYATEVSESSGNAFDFYFQLIDKNKNQAQNGFNPPGLRYMPASGATATVDILNIDDSKEFTRTATNPFAEDTSIWKISLLSTDPLSGTISLKINLTEGANVRTISMQAVILVDSINEVC